MKAAEIVDLAWMLQSDAPHPLRRTVTSQSLFLAVAVWTTKSLLAHSIVSPTCAEILARDRGQIQRENGKKD